MALAVSALTGGPLTARFTASALLLAVVMLGVGLAASFLHLGRPERAWRAMAMWRTSWLSREVIVLPAFMAVGVSAIEDAEGFMHVACGSAHTVALTRSGAVFTWGSNSHGQCARKVFIYICIYLYLCVHHI